MQSCGGPRSLSGSHLNSDQGYPRQYPSDLLIWKPLPSWFLVTPLTLSYLWGKVSSLNYLPI